MRAKEVLKEMHKSRELESTDSFMTQNYQDSSLLPKTIDSDSSGTTNPKISPILKFF